MHIDCDYCQMRGPACSDCVVSVLLGPPDAEWGSEERAAIGVLAEAGLVPPLRLVTAETESSWPREDGHEKSSTTSARDLPRAGSAG